MVHGKCGARLTARLTHATYGRGRELVARLLTEGPSPMHVAGCIYHGLPKLEAADLTVAVCIHVAHPVVDAPEALPWLAPLLVRCRLETLIQVIQGLQALVRLRVGHVRRKRLRQAAFECRQIRRLEGLWVFTRRLHSLGALPFRLCKHSKELGGAHVLPLHLPPRLAAVTTSRGRGRLLDDIEHWALDRRCWR